MLAKLFIYLIIVIIFLLIFKFLIELWNDHTELNNINTFFKAISLIIFLLIILLLSFNFISSIITSIKYTTLTIYLLMHIIIFAIVCYLNLALMMMIVSSYTFIKSTIISIFKHKKVNGSYKKIFKFIHKNLDPFYTINFEKITITKFVKIIFILSYLISGVIVLSYCYNYFKLNNYIPENFNNDYEIYKSVFVVSLIPFTINYLTNRNKK